MRRALAVTLGLIVSGLGCLPRGQMPPEVGSLRSQLRRKTITIPIWTQEVVEELAARANDYAGKTLVVESATLAARGEVRVGSDPCTFPLSGGGTVVVPAAGVPPWLRSRTGAPLKFRATLPPPRRGSEGSDLGDPVLHAQAIDLAHPLELAFVQIETTPEGTWLIAHIENYRGEGARATLDLRFGGLRESRRLPAVAPGQATAVRLKLFGPTAPPWESLPPGLRALRLVGDDGSATQVDLGRWLEGPPDSMLDWGYTFTPPGSAVMMLSSDKPEAELERFAALELRSYLAQFTDANIEPREPLPGDDEPLPPQPLLVVGTPQHNKLAAELVRTAGLEGRLPGLGNDGYLLKSLRHGGQPALLVTAAAPRGLVYGVYALLERYGVQFSMFGTRLPARGPFRVLDLDEARTPLFARRALVAEGPRPDWAARWSQWQWLAMVDLAAKNRFNQAVIPLDGLEATFTYEAKRSREALFPFDIQPPYTCVAEAYLAHQRGLAILVDYARRRGMEVVFARRDGQGKLRAAPPPACAAAAPAAEAAGQALDVLDDPGDFLGLARVEEAAATAARLVAAKATAIAVPYRPGAAARASFLARFAWDPTLTPEAHFRRWAEGLCEGQAAATLAKAALDSDRLDADLLAAIPRPFGQGAGLVLPVEPDDPASDWAALRARATSAAAATQIQEIRAQSQKLRDLQTRMEPIHAAFREALEAAAPPWEGPLFEAAPAARRAERIAESIYRFRALLGALASVQEGALAYYAAVTNPPEALPQLAVACTKLRKARRILLWVLSRSAESDMAPTLADLAQRLDQQAARLAEWLGPAADAEPAARLTLAGSDAVVHLFRTRTEDILAAYKLAGDEAVHLRLNTPEARLYRRGQEPRTLRAEGGLFLVPLGPVPTYLVARRAAWPGAPAP